MKGLLGLMLLMVLGASNAQNSEVTAIMEQILDGYDKRIRPNFGGGPLEVGITMYFIRIFDISTKEQSMKSDFYLRHTWTDPRLAFNATPQVQYITLDQESSKMFWQPDTFFPEGSTTSPHEGNQFFKINSDGTVLKSIRLILKSGLDMDLHYFPMDKPTVSLSLESYGYSAKDVKYSWARNLQSVGISNDVGTSDITVRSFELQSETIHLSTGNYSRLKINFQMARKGGYYLSHFYLPAVISFFLVWGSFWFHPTATVARLLLVLASFLTGNYLLASSWNFSPAVGYSTMLDKFVVFGLILTGLAVAESALVVHLERRMRKAHLAADLLEGGEKPTEKKELVDAEKPGQDPASYLARSTRYLLTIHQHRRNYYKIDIFFRVIYPVIYIIYNVWYWMSFP